MTVSELKEYLDGYDDRADIYYFDSEMGEDFPMITSRITIVDNFRELENT